MTTEEQWPKALVVTATYTRKFESEKVVKDRIQQICRDLAVCLPDDEDMKAEHERDWQDANPDAEGPWVYDDAKQKDEFHSYYPDVNWPPKTLEDLGGMFVKDFVDGDAEPSDEKFEDDPDWDSEVVEVPV